MAYAIHSQVAVDAQILTLEPTAPKQLALMIAGGTANAKITIVNVKKDMKGKTVERKHVPKRHQILGEGGSAVGTANVIKVWEHACVRLAGARSALADRRTQGFVSRNFVPTAAAAMVVATRPLEHVNAILDSQATIAHPQRSCGMARK
jgi:hypothetical protein